MLKKLDYWRIALIHLELAAGRDGRTRAIFDPDRDEMPLEPCGAGWNGCADRVAAARFDGSQ